MSEEQAVEQQVINIGGADYKVSDEAWLICQSCASAFHSFRLNSQPRYSGFQFGAASLHNLSEVYPPLALLASYALILSDQDFGITDGLRTPQEQVKNVAKGVSRTLHSMHLAQKDGYSHAIDCVPFKGHYTWDWERIYSVAAAMHKAASITGCADKIRWGGAWDRRLSDFGDKPEDFEQGVKAYAIRHQGSDLLDGPHFEWVLN